MENNQVNKDEQEQLPPALPVGVNPSDQPELNSQDIKIDLPDYEEIKSQEKKNNLDVGYSSNSNNIYGNNQINFINKIDNNISKNNNHLNENLNTQNTHDKTPKSESNTSPNIQKKRMIDKENYVHNYNNKIMEYGDKITQKYNKDNSNIDKSDSKEEFRRDRKGINLQKFNINSNYEQEMGLPVENISSNQSASQSLHSRKDSCDCDCCYCNPPQNPLCDACCEASSKFCCFIIFLSYLFCILCYITYFFFVFGRCIYSLIRCCFV